MSNYVSDIEQTELDGKLGWVTDHYKDEEEEYEFFPADTLSKEYELEIGWWADKHPELKNFELMEHRPKVEKALEIILSNEEAFFGKNISNLRDNYEEDFEEIQERVEEESWRWK